MTTRDGDGYYGDTLNDPMAAPKGIIIQGITGGETIAEGKVGETINTVGTGTVLPAASNAWKTVVSKAVKPGKYVITGKLFFYNGTNAPTAATFEHLAAVIATTADNGGDVIDEIFTHPVPGNLRSTCVVTAPKIINITVGTTFYLNGSAIYGTLNDGSWGASLSQIIIQRII